jgi:hypothetical protein
MNDKWSAEETTDFKSSLDTSRKVTIAIRVGHIIHGIQPWVDGVLNLVVVVSTLRRCIETGRTVM